MEFPPCISRKDFLISIIQKIGKFQMQYFGQEIAFETKSNDMDFVSFVDKESEQIFREELQKKFPQDIVMGEEGENKGHDYPQEQHLWIIDPVDGTLLFKKGIPLFGVMIAYIEQGQVQLSAIYLPAIGELYSADIDGAYKNGQLVHVSDEAKLTSSLIHIPNYSKEKLLGDMPFQSFLKQVGTCVDFYSVAYPITSCASGKIEGGAFCPSFGCNDNIWDSIPGGFLIQQAGGKVTTLGQDTWNIWDSRILYSNGQIHQDLEGALSK